jgi:hypothetical protein
LEAPSLLEAVSEPLGLQAPSAKAAAKVTKIERMRPLLVVWRSA